jgi:glucose/arabinose dehydrogenase
LLAKLLRIDVNSRTTTRMGDQTRTLQYGIPSDNPFINEPEMWEGGVRKEIYAWGLRNMWRYSWDRETGDLWGGDVGQDLWEEVDLIVKGGNYGWCAREGTHYFKPAPPGAQYIDPVMEYPHSPGLSSKCLFPDHSPGLCVTGGYVYRGKKYPSLQGVYVYGDFALGTVWGFRYQNGKITQSATLLEQPKNIASFAEDADGELYLIGLDAGIFSISVKN